MTVPQSRSPFYHSPPSTPESLAYIHIFKTGGTTASDWISSHFPAGSTFVPSDPDSFASTASSQNLDSFDLIRGHFFMCHAALLFRRPRVIFTMLRKPEAHVMSALWHLVSYARGDIDVGRRKHAPFSDGSLVELAKAALRFRMQRTGAQACFLVTRADLLQTQRLSAAKSSTLEGLAQCHVVGLTERLEDSLRLLAWRMKWPAPRDIGTARQSGAGRHPTPLIIKAILRRHLQLDRLLYENACQRFIADFAALSAAAGSPLAIDDYLDAVATQNAHACPSPGSSSDTPASA